MSVWYISIKVHIFHMVSVIKGTFLFTKALLFITFICKKKKTHTFSAYRAISGLTINKQIQ